jgi:hypothetical protein
MLTEWTYFTSRFSRLALARIPGRRSVPSDGHTLRVCKVGSGRCRVSPSRQAGGGWTKADVMSYFIHHLGGVRDLADLLLMRELVPDLAGVREAGVEVFALRGAHAWPPQTQNALPGGTPNKSRRATRFTKWAWEDLNFRPHAYQMSADRWWALVSAGNQPSAPNLRSWALASAGGRCHRFCYSSVSGLPCECGVRDQNPPGRPTTTRLKTPKYPREPTASRSAEFWNRTGYRALYADTNRLILRSALRCSACHRS